MKRDFQNQYVVIDDIIGKRQSLSFLNSLRREGLLSKHFVILGIAEIQRRILNKLDKKKYDLMLFVESGGPYILGTPTVMKHAKKSFAIPLSSHSNSDELNAIKYVAKFTPEIIRSSTIAVVDGDAGREGLSVERLYRVKEAIIKINKEAKVEVIVGVATKSAMAEQMSFGRLFDIVGVVVEDMLKLSDYAHDIETERKLGHKVTPLQLKLLDYCNSRKPHKVPLK